MDEVINKAKELRKAIDSLPLAKEYFSLKELFENDKELKKMRQDIARLKQEGKEKERENLLALYNSHPLVNNYYSLKEEMESLLKSILDIIQ